MFRRLRYPITFYLSIILSIAFSDETKKFKSDLLLDHDDNVVFDIAPNCRILFCIFDDDLDFHIEQLDPNCDFDLFHMVHDLTSHQ